MFDQGLWTAQKPIKEHYSVNGEASVYSHVNCHRISFSWLLLFFVPSKTWSTTVGEYSIRHKKVSIQILRSQWRFSVKLGSYWCSIIFQILANTELPGFGFLYITIKIVNMKEQEIWKTAWTKKSNHCCCFCIDTVLCYILYSPTVTLISFDWRAII